jgi:hypothetical protein
VLKVLSQNATLLISPEQQYEWIELTGKELEIAETEKDGVFSVSLNIKPQGAKKTPTSLIVIATIAIAAEVSTEYEKDEKLQPTITAFANAQIAPKIDQIDQYIDRAMRDSRVINITAIQPIDIKIAERVERDDAGEIVSTDITAEIGGSVYVYSSAGVFDLQAV